MIEPKITINGKELSDGQAMALRVAVTAYYQELEDPDSFGTDKHGRAQVRAYRDRLREILAMVIQP